MSDLAIIRNAPPPSDDRRGRRRVYPWGELSVGDAFDVPADPRDEKGGQRHPTHNAVSASCSSRNLREKAAGTGCRFICRYLREDKVVRVWKVRA